MQKSWCSRKFKKKEVEAEMNLKQGLFLFMVDFLLCCLFSWVVSLGRYYPFLLILTLCALAQIIVLGVVFVPIVVGYIYDKLNG